MEPGAFITIPFRLDDDVKSQGVQPCADARRRSLHDICATFNLAAIIVQTKHRGVSLNSSVAFAQ